MKNSLIPVYKPTLVGNEKRYVAECLDDTWISSKGKFVGLFEENFASYLGLGFATSVSNGTVALHLALHTLGISQGDEVIVPTLTYIASVNTISYTGAKPVFVDAEPDTWNMNVSLIEKKITPRTKAIMAVHLYGAVCDMNILQALCEKHNLFLIEDAAEAFGSLYQGQYAGSFGDISTFSFFGNKTITTGEGGMVVSQKESTIQRAAFLKSQGVSPTQEYWHDEIGFNYRMTNICAAIGVAQLEHADSIIEAKRRIANWYQEELSGLPLSFQKESSQTVQNYWMISILAENIDMCDKIRIALKNVRIETRPFFYPAHIMPIYRCEEVFPVAENLYPRGISLPSFPTLTHSQIKDISLKIRQAI
jgi:perosamine synthetase